MSFNKTVAAFLLPFLLLTPTLTTTTQKKLTISEQEINCLAENIYFEANNQSKAGKMGVAFVTINRTQSKHYPSNVCEVVYQKSNQTCQFSWVCSKKLKRDEKHFQEAKHIARHVALRYHHIHDITEGALFFHASYVKPVWRMKHIKTVQIDDHIFYRKRST